MSGHGWVYPNPGGAVARCGGPAICPQCSQEFTQKALHDKKAHGEAIEKDQNFYERMGMCDLCGVQVAHEDKQLHLDWHERLRRAVDETGMIG